MRAQCTGGNPNATDTDRAAADGQRAGQMGPSVQLQVQPRIDRFGIVLQETHR